MIKANGRTITLTDADNFKTPESYWRMIQLTGSGLHIEQRLSGGTSDETRPHRPEMDRRLLRTPRGTLEESEHPHDINNSNNLASNKDKYRRPIAPTHILVATRGDML